MWLNSPSPGPPFSTWATAAHTIQEAVDAAWAHDTVRVTNGVFATGGRAIAGAMTNRVVLDKALTVQSVNGPAVTIIQGAASPGGGNGDGAIRCVYLGSNAVLSGFTLTNGHTRIAGDYREQCGGGVWCESSGAVSNCLIFRNSASSSGGGTYAGTLYHCTLAGNSAEEGGGARGGTLTNCLLTGNTADRGGGSTWSTLYSCTVSSNSASSSGGGIYYGTLTNCTLTGNSAPDGGGAYHGTLADCLLTGNSATNAGGGAYQGTLTNCALTGNSAGEGGGTYGGALHQCLVSSNSARSYGGGISGSTLYASVLLGNSAGSRGGGAYSGTLYNCLVSGNVASVLSGTGGGAYGGTLYHCTLTGNSARSSGGISGGTLVNCIVYYNTTSFPGAANWSGATFTYSCTTPLPAGEGNLSAEPWFLDQTGGDFHLRHDSPCIDAGTNLSALLTTDLDGNRRPLDGDRDGTFDFDLGAYEYTLALHVWADSPSPTPPYADWATAAHTLQEAVDAARRGDTVRVTNGVYATGGRAVFGTMTNRVAIDRAITVQSVNGPAVTIILGAAAPGGGNGDGAVRCVYLGYDAMLSGFTLTNGHTRTAGDEYREQRGGGVWCESSGVVTNWLLIGNAAYRGGGACAGRLHDCTLSGNSAEYGGGAYQGTLDHCRLTQNVAAEGAGAYDADLKGYYDGIPHDKLIACVRMRVADRSVLGLIRMWLGAPIVEEKDSRKLPPRSNDQGTPQGGVVSPLLANIYLHWFDKKFHRKDDPANWAKARLTRYADDFVIQARYQSSRLQQWVEGELEGWLGLVINREKTRTIQLRDEAATLDFLGYGFRYEKDLKGRPWRYLNLFPSRKSLEKEREKIRELTGPKQCFKPVSDLVEELNEHLVGWKNYFKVGYCRREFRKLNDFVQHRMIKHLHRRSQRGYKLPQRTSV